jgi:predicted deacetylase
MKTGVALALIAIGAIFAFAVTTNTSVFNLHTAGWVLMIIGVIGIAIPRRGYGWVGRRVITRQTRMRPRGRVEEVTYPTYVNRNPANTRVQAGLPAPGSLSGTEPATRDLTAEVRPVGEQEVVEDVYDE